MRRLEVPEVKREENAARCAEKMQEEIPAAEKEAMPQKEEKKIFGKFLNKGSKKEQKGAVLCPYEEFIKDRLFVEFEDENLIIVNKMPGMPVGNEVNAGEGTLLNLVEEYMKEHSSYIIESGNVPYACHFQDETAGGLTMFTKNGEVYDDIYKAIKQRRIVRYYTAFIAGVPREKEAELTGFLRADPSLPKVKIVKTYEKTARPIVTRYKVLESYEDFSKVEIELVTGARHQIRAHMASVGYPILGDDVYGNKKINKKLGINMSALWATKMVFYTGVNNPLAYLDKKEIRASEVLLPKTVIND